RNYNAAAPERGTFFRCAPFLELRIAKNCSRLLVAFSDPAHFPFALRSLLALRVHLDDSNETNGPLRVIPDTHCCGVLTDEQVRERSADSPGAACVVPAGGVIAMRPLIIHASSKSESDLPRRVLHI